MKKLLILNAAALLTLSAQTADVLPPPLTGVSESFKTYAERNLTAPFSVAADGDVEVNPNQLYIPRPSGGAHRVGVAAATVSTPASTMYNQTSGGTLPVSVVGNFTGLGAGFPNWTDQGLLPPDTTMAIGNNQIVQWVNVRLTVLNKSNGTTQLGGAGFVAANQIWAGLGASSVCATANRGDPVLQYDRMANRWVLSQFAFNIATRTNTPPATYPAPPYAFCIAVSQTNDATGVFNLYEYVVPALPDYPKLGVWPDAYYMTANDITFNTATGASSYNPVRASARLTGRRCWLAPQRDPCASAVCRQLILPCSRAISRVPSRRRRTRRSTSFPPTGLPSTLLLTPCSCGVSNRTLRLLPIRR